MRCNTAQQASWIQQLWVRDRLRVQYLRRKYPQISEQELLLKLSHARWGANEPKRRPEIPYLFSLFPNPSQPVRDQLTQAEMDRYRELITG